MTRSAETLAASLQAEAAAANQRRLLVLAGDREAGWRAAHAAVDAAGVDDGAVTAITTRTTGRFERLSPARAESLLGETRRVVVCDAHEDFSPNTLGRVVGSVDGGGLFVLLTPSLNEWATDRMDVDERLAVPPFSSEDVTSRFRQRFVETLETHPGVAIVDVDTGQVRRDGSTDGPSRVESTRVPVSDGHAFPRAAYEACLTPDQARAVRALEGLCGEGERAVVVEADRGRGKSSAAGIAAASLVAAGREVLVTAPHYRNAREVFVRAAALLETLGFTVDRDVDGEAAHVLSAERVDGPDGDGPRCRDTVGQLSFRRPPEAVEAVAAGDPDVVLVDEAAALPVRVLERLLDAPAVAFFTTVHGYEGAGRGFSVRFRDRLAAADHDVADVRLDDPIRYARGDPVESWAFRALLLDARPPVEEAIEDATLESVTYEAPSADDLLADEHLLGEVFGLLVLAHYRTEPDDLARLLDAPNLSVRTLTYRGHVVSVALLAREGALDEATRREMYEGSRVRGNMLPDVLTSQLRDQAAAAPTGLRVMRIATHHALRSQGFGSRLLSEVRTEFDEELDWLGVGFGATPQLVSFWRENGFRTLYLSISRNERSGEHSVVMLDPLSAAGRRLHDRHTRWFRDRLEGTLSDPLCDLDPDVVRASLRAVDGPVPLSLSEREWRVVVDASFGPGLYSVHPTPFRRLALRALTADDDERATLDEAEALTPREERLLVRKVLQAHPWGRVAEELDYVSTGRCMKALGEAYQPLVRRYGGDAASEQRRRYE